MAKRSDYLRNQEHPTVFGYELDRATLLPIKRFYVPRDEPPVPFSDDDRALIAKYGGTCESVEAGGFAGLADRMKRGAR